MLQKVTQEPLTRDQLLQKETLKGINKQQLKRQITIINQKQQQKESRYQTATAGRNSLVVSVTLGKLFFKFAIGIFDEFSGKRN